MTTRHGTRVGVTGAVLAIVAALSGCGAGQQAQTGNQVTASGGAVGQAGAILVRDAHFAWTGPVPGDSVYEIGEDAPLQVTIINDTTIVVGGADRLIAVSSPIATSGRILGETRIAGGQTISAGYDKPIAGIAPPPEGTVGITLVGLTSPVRAGLTYPVVFTFERAGELRIDNVPVENPDVLPPRAR